MKAAVFVDEGLIALDERPIPDIGPLDALVRTTTTTICGTDALEPRGLLEGSADPARRIRRRSHQRDGVLKVAITP